MRKLNNIYTFILSTILILRTYFCIRYMWHSESFFDFLPDIEEIGEIFFDNKLYSNIGNETSGIINTGDVSEYQSEADDEDSVSSDGGADADSDSDSDSHSDQNEDQDSVSSGEGADSDSVRSDDATTCVHVTNPGGPACECPHVEAGNDWRISTHHDRCHACSLPGATLTCDVCICLFHAECLPADCDIHSDWTD